MLGRNAGNFPKIFSESKKDADIQFERGIDLTKVLHSRGVESTEDDVMNTWQ